MLFVSLKLQQYGTLSYASSNIVGTWCSFKASVSEKPLPPGIHKQIWAASLSGRNNG